VRDGRDTLSDGKYYPGFENLSITQFFALACHSAGQGAVCSHSSTVRVGISVTIPVAAAVRAELAKIVDVTVKDAPQLLRQAV
jgi:hypothetical protein